MRKLDAPPPDTSGTLEHQKKYLETMMSNAVNIFSYLKNQTNYYFKNYFQKRKKNKIYADIRPQILVLFFFN